MRLSWLQAVFALFLAAILSAPAWGTTTPLPGTLNYIEGQAKIGSEAVDSKSIGSVQLQPGESLSTADNGQAEILLTPGVFLRLGDNSSAKMISTNLANTKVDLKQGQAMVEVDQIHKENDVEVAQGDATAQLLKTGLYGFDAQRDQVRVFDGEALVREGDQQVKVKSGREVDLNAAKLKPAKFDKNAYKDDLYRFSSLRADYLAQANTQATQVYVNYGWWPAAGWWWNPWFGGYTFIPAGGVFYSPFGWSFYPTRVIVPVAPGLRPRPGAPPLRVYRGFAPHQGIGHPAGGFRGGMGFHRG
jgi:hypothetical protein